MLFNIVFDIDEILMLMILNWLLSLIKLLGLSKILIKFPF